MRRAGRLIWDLISCSWLKGATNQSADFDETWQWVLGHVNIEWKNTFIGLAADQSKLAPREVQNFWTLAFATRLSDRDGTVTILTGRSRRRRDAKFRSAPTSLADSSFLASSSTLYLRQILPEFNEIGSKMIVKMSRIYCPRQKIVLVLQYIFCALKWKKF